MRQVALFLCRILRLLSLVVLAALGCVLLMRYAPGYFSDAREMDGAYAHQARTELDTLHETQDSPRALLLQQFSSWRHGELGTSRHYEVPVSGLLRERALPSLNLLTRGVGVGWLLAAAFALPLSGRRTAGGEVAIVTASAFLLAVPAGVLATLAFLSNKGGPVFVLALLVAARDFKLLYRILRSAWRQPHILHARAQGFSPSAVLRVHLLPVLSRELLALAMMSSVVAISALVPVEVIFNVPGLGQLAWTAALNRDMPVLVAATVILAGCIGLAELFTDPGHATEVAQCA